MRLRLSLPGDCFKNAIYSMGKTVSSGIHALKNPLQESKMRTDCSSENVTNLINIILMNYSIKSRVEIIQ